MKRTRLLLPIFLLAIIAIVSPPSLALTADWNATAEEVAGHLDFAAERYAAGNPEGAREAINAAYFGPFEEQGMEATIRMKISTQRAFQIEYAFTVLKQLVQKGVPAAEFQVAVTKLQADIRLAGETLSGGRSEKSDGGAPWDTFFYSFLIIVREGFEAILIVGAIVGYLIKAGRRDKVAIIRHSVVAALVASVITAIAFQYVFHISGAGREILEGVTMLVATLVLFFVSFWLMSKAEAKRWQAFIESTLKASLSTGSKLTLWLTAFLAVYREGAETVLFYQALFVGMETGHVYAAGGFVLGCGVLVLIYLAVHFASLRLPRKAFFVVTGILLYYMAFIFGGKGIRELQEADVVASTPVSFVPTIDFIGVYPFWEPLAVQAVLVAALIGGITYEIMRSRAPQTIQ
jgi:high-affinity iron transporter